MGFAARAKMEQLTEHWGYSALGLHTLPALSSVSPGLQLAADSDPVLCLVAHEGHLFVPDPFPG